MLSLLRRRPWYADLVERYGVTAAQALELGTRRAGRRPDLPSGQTCPAVTGRTLEEIWAAAARDSQEAVEQFYRDMGTWAVFRQSVRNRRRSWAFVDRRLPWGAGRRLWILEFGCGIAPCAAWLLERRGKWNAGIVLMDVEGSEALDFASWRLERRAEALDSPWFIATESKQRSWLLDAVVATEVLEHVPDPLGAVQWLAACLKPGRFLFEDFHRHGPGDEGAPWDLSSAQAARPAVYAFLQERFAFVEGRSWDAQDGGGTRTWQRR